MSTRDSDKKFERERENRIRHHSQIGAGKHSRRHDGESTARRESDLDLFEPERLEGWLITWNADRGFGFIGASPNQRKGSFFVHQTRVRRIDGERPQLVVGTKVLFARGQDREGRPCAIDVQVLEWPQMTIEEFFLQSAEQAPSILPQ